MATTREEFDEWQELRVTKDMKKRIKADITYMQDLLVNAALEDVKELQGRIKTCYNLLDMTYEGMYSDN